MCSSLIYSHVAVCTVRYVMSLVFASLCYFLIIRPMFFNIPSMFVFLFCMFYFLFCVFCVFVLFYALFLLLYTQVYRSLPQGRNPVSVNKYHIVYTLFRPYIYIYTYIQSFSSLSFDRSKASSKASSPHSAIQSFLFQMRVSSPFLKVIQ